MISEMQSSDSVLTVETLKKARDIMLNELAFTLKVFPIHESLWNDYKEHFSLTDTEMNKLFLKSSYIEL